MKIMRYFRLKTLFISIVLLFLSVVTVMATPGAPQNVRFANHSFTGLPLTDKGWTNFNVLTDRGYSSARVLFVSSLSGNDNAAANNISANGHYGIADVTFDSNGIFQAPGGVVPFATISTAYAYCRNGYPDVLLLERGGSWSAGLGKYAKSGLSQNTPHIIATYGSSGDRPRLTDTAISTRDAHYLIVSGIHFYSASWTEAGRAIDARGNASYQTFEDLYIEQKSGDIVQGQSGEYCQYIAFRRCVWTHGEAHDGQLYAQQANHVLVEECIFHEPYDDSYTDKSRFGRFFYFTSEGTSGPQYHDYLNNVIMRGNIFYNGERDAVDLRSGGEFSYNLVIASNYNYFGGRGGSENTVQDLDLKYNVFSQGTPTVTGYNSCQIINIDGGTITDNIWTDNTNIGPYGSALALSGDNNVLDIARNITISNNIFYGWDTENNFNTDRDFSDVKNISITGNDFMLVNGGTIINNRTWGEGAYRFEGYTYSNNRYYSTSKSTGWFIPSGDYSGWVSESGETGASNSKVSYTDPGRTVGGFSGSLGRTATTEAFMASLLNQSRHNWDSNLTAYSAINYIRTGFDKDPVKPNW